MLIINIIYFFIKIKDIQIVSKKIIIIDFFLMSIIKLILFIFLLKFKIYTFFLEVFKLIMIILYILNYLNYY